MGRSKFIAPVIGYIRYRRGNVPSLPFNSSTPSMSHNKDIFKKRD